MADELICPNCDRVLASEADFVDESSCTYCKSWYVERLPIDVADDDENEINAISNSFGNESSYVSLSNLVKHMKALGWQFLPVSRLAETLRCSFCNKDIVLEDVYFTAVVDKSYINLKEDRPTEKHGPWPVACCIRCSSQGRAQRPNSGGFYIIRVAH